MPISHRGTDSGLLNGRLLQQAPLPYHDKIPTPKGYGLYHDSYPEDADKGFELVTPEGEDKGWLGHDEIGSHPPLQGTLFSSDQFRDSQYFPSGRRWEALASHTVFREGSRPTDTDEARGEVEAPVMRAMKESSMPSELIKALRGTTQVSVAPSLVRGGRGYYLPGEESGPITVSGKPRRPSIFHDDEGIEVSSKLVRHELGHRADYRSHLAERLPYGDTDDGWPEHGANALKITTSRKNPDPRVEGVADGFADRYIPQKEKIWNQSNDHTESERDLIKQAAKDGADLGDRPVGEFSHYQSTFGYSSAPRYVGAVGGEATWVDRYNWPAADRALYTAIRSHFSKTGENPTADASVSKSDSSSFSDPDRSLLAKLSMTSPHAVQALEDNSTKYNDLNAESKYARDAYTMSRKVGTQFSLFSEHSAESPSGSRYIGMSINPNVVPHDEQDLSGIRSALLPGERIKTRSMDKPVHDIPDDFKPTPEAEQAINAIRNPPKKMER